MAKEFTNEDDALLAELGIEVEAQKSCHTNATRRADYCGALKKFSDLWTSMGRAPQHGEKQRYF